MSGSKFECGEGAVKRVVESTGNMVYEDVEMNIKKVQSDQDA